MRRLLSAFFRTRSIVSASLVILALTLATKLTGLGRVATVAHLFGASEKTDAFLTAFLIPECIFLFFTEGALTAALVPVLTKWSRVKDGQLGALVGTLLTLAVFLGFALICPLYIFTERAISLLAPGFSPATLELTTSLFRIVLPYIPLLAAAGVFYALLHTEGHFTAPALGPLLFNVAIITMAYSFHSQFGIAALAWGVLIGGAAQLILQILPYRRLNPHLKLSIDFSHPGLAEAMALLTPIALSLIIVQLNIVGVRIMASSLVPGSITGLNFAQKIINLPLGIFGIAISTAILPTLARLSQEKRIKDFSTTVTNALSMSFILLLPLSASMVLGRNWIVSLALKRGAFAEAQTLMTANLLGWYAVGIACVSATMLLTRAFLARNDGRTPALLKSIAVIIHLILCWIFISRWGIQAIPAAFSISYGLHFLFSLILLGRGKEGISPKTTIIEILRILIATVVAFASASWLCTFAPGVGKAAELTRLLLLSIPGFIGTCIIAHLLGSQGTRESIRLVREKLGTTSPH